MNAQYEPAVRQFWETYTREAQLSGVRYRVYSLGDTSGLADELLARVLSGRMRATTRLYRDLLTRAEAIPQTGELSVVVDGSSRPRCILRTVDVNVKALSDVDERFASDEGGGDGSLSWWMTAHKRYFKRQAAREGFVVDDETQVVLERFEVVWPPEFADRIGFAP